MERLVVQTKNQRDAGTDNLVPAMDSSSRTV
jgi:hypothetical protein